MFCHTLDVKNTRHPDPSLSPAPAAPRPSAATQTDENLLFVETDERPTLPPGSIVLLVGDSLGVGISSRFKELASQCGYRPVTHVIVGTNVFQWIEWIKKDMIEHKPGLVLVVLGTNDAAQLSLVKKQDSYRRLVGLLGDARYLWILPHGISPARVPQIDATRAFIKESVENYFDSTMIQVPLAPDKVHSSPTGYKLWMESIWERLKTDAIIRNCSK